MTEATAAAPSIPDISLVSEIPLTPGATARDLHLAVKRQLPTRSPVIFDRLLADYMSRPGLSVLEIGVFLATNVEYAMTRYPHLGRYWGIDDYGRSGNSPYVKPGSYWASQADADAQYERSKAIFDRFGQRLFRCTAEEYIRDHAAGESFDIVFVDGNHAYEHALADMRNYFPLVKPGGALLIDDYDNCDQRGVTPAITEFFEQNAEALSAVRYARVPFVKKDKILPVGLTLIALIKR